MGEAEEERALPMRGEKRRHQSDIEDEGEDELSDDDDDDKENKEPVKNKSGKTGINSQAAREERYQRCLQADPAARQAALRGISVTSDHPDATLTYKGFKKMLHAIVYAKGTNLNVRYVFRTRAYTSLIAFQPRRRYECIPATT